MKLHVSALNSLTIRKEAVQIIDWSDMIIEVLQSSPLNFMHILDQQKFDLITIKICQFMSIAPDFAM